jgi:hypothetical protein
MKAIAQIISIVFHPLLIMTYGAVLMLLVNPYLFGAHHISSASVLLLRIFLTSFLLPAVAVGMMRALGLIGSLQMEDKQDRIGPMIATGIFYIWMFYTFYKSELIPKPYTAFVLGGTIALFIAFVLNAFEKISLHAIGMGGLLGMTIIAIWRYSYGDFQVGQFSVSTQALLMAVIVLCGLVGTARLLLGAHSTEEVYKGYLLGLSTQFIALLFVS